MLNQTRAYAENKILPLISTIGSNANDLIQQEVQFAKCAIQRESELTAKSLSNGVYGAAFLAPALVLVGFGLVELSMIAFPELPRWAAFSIVGIGCLAFALSQLAQAKSHLQSVGDSSGEILEHLQENLLWLKTMLH